MDLRLPKLGEGADAGVVVSVLVKEGDHVKEGQALIELENEKAVAPIPATANGKVTRIRVKEGDRISVGQVILSIDTGGVEGKPAREGPAEETPKKAPWASHRPAEMIEAGEEELVAKTEAEVAAAPSIRRVARELGIDLTRVPGSERGGRIVMADLRAYIQRLQRLASAQPKQGIAAAQTQAVRPESVDYSKWGPVTRKPVSPLRKVISQRMAESWTTVPRVTQFDEADITVLMELRKKYQAAYEAKGAHLTLTPLAVKALVAALKKHPIFNSSLDEAAGEIVFKEYFHIGVAVDTDAGLIVPVVRDADKKGLLQLANEVEALAAKARERRLSLEEMKGGTFTISNQGGIGGAHFTPIINLPEVAILGLGRGALKAVVRDKQVQARLMLPLAVSYDHRVIDGGTAARFTADLAQALENLSEDEVRL